MSQYYILRLKSLLLLVIMSNSMVLLGQSSSVLENAKSFSDKKEYSKTVDLLNNYYPNHKDELYTSWLYADALFNTSGIKKAKSIYQNIIESHPKDNNIKIDFANKLMNSGKLNMAQWYFESTTDLTKDQKFIVNKSLAQIYYWKGKYDDAEENFGFASMIYPEDKGIRMIGDQIQSARSNWLSLGIGYFSDDQPLTSILPSVTNGIYINENLTVGTQLDIPFYSLDSSNYNSQWIQGFVKYQLLDYSTSLRLDGGLVRMPTNSYEWTGKLSISNNIWKYLILGVYAGREPYFATIDALNIDILPYKYGINIDWKNPNGFIGKASWDINNFTDYNNTIQTQSAWLVSPAIKYGIFEFRGGYGINYSDSEKSNFESEIPLENILTDWDTTTVIDGVYRPFFTPSNQLIHSAIGMITLHPTSSIDIGINANYGLYATTDAPYLDLGKDIDTEDIVIDRKFYNRTYHPLDIDVNLLYKLNNKVGIKAYYKYQKTNYYTSHFTGLTTSIHF